MLGTFRKSMIVLVTMACVYVSGVASSSEGDSSARVSAVLTLTDSNFEHDTQAASGSTTGDWFVLFLSPKCVHCHRVMPAWEELGKAMKGQMNIGKLDVSSNPETAGRFGIRGIPVLALFRHGKMYKFPANSERSLENLSNFAEGGYDRVTGETVPKIQSMSEVAKEFLQRGLADGKEFLEKGLAGTQKVYETVPHVVYFTAGAGAMAAMVVMLLLKLCCWAVRGKCASSQAPSSKRRTYKKD
eukprot:GHVS01028164.1.p1 GENE.GHVS01028164.1~~GHVS01028164.1.p1  ORF type:complete len:243 (+),score=28.64 GHVS01028164.1:67-795(+)